MDDETFLEEYLTMENGINDNVLVPGEVFSRFRQESLPAEPAREEPDAQGRETVDLRQITCPVLNLLATQDTLVPPSQSEPFTRPRRPRRTKKTIELPTGHLGLANGLRRKRRSSSGRRRRRGWRNGRIDSRVRSSSTRPTNNSLHKMDHSLRRQNLHPGDIIDSLSHFAPR